MSLLVHHDRLHDDLGDIPSVELKARYAAQTKTTTSLNQDRKTNNPGPPKQ